MHWWRKREGEVEFGFDRIAGRIEWEAQLTPAEREAFAEYNAGWSREEREGWSMSNPERVPCPLAESRQQSAFLLDEAKRFMSEERDAPFLSFNEPHAPFVFPERLSDAVDPTRLELPAFDPAAIAREVPGLGVVLSNRDIQRGRSATSSSILSSLPT